MSDRLSIVIPCLNEEASIADVVRAAQAGIADLGVPGEVIVVDNGSTDRSADRAAAAGARVVHESRRGYGAAIRRGFAAARHEILVMADGDLSYDLTRLRELAAPVIEGAADLVVGNRLDGVHEGAMPRLHRHVGTPALTWMLRLLFGKVSLKDSQCGFRVIRRAAYERLNCLTTGMEFASEMIAKAALADLRIAERDIEYHPRAGESKLRPLRDGWRHLRFLLLYVPSPAILVPLLTVWLITATVMAMLALGPLRIRSQQFDVHSMLMLAILNVASLQILTGAMTARIYAHLNGFRPDALIAWFYRRLHFGSAIAVSAACLLLGLAGLLFFGSQFVRRPELFQRPDTTRLMLLSLCLIVNGLQLWLAGYLASIMALPRHLDALPPEAENTALADVE
jgi:glycosyltransferase involved in cell wall biosynthesis